MHSRTPNVELKTLTLERNGVTAEFVKKLPLTKKIFFATEVHFYRLNELMFSLKAFSSKDLANMLFTAKQLLDFTKAEDIKVQEFMGMSSHTLRALNHVDALTLEENTGFPNLILATVNDGKDQKIAINNNLKQWGTVTLVDAQDEETNFVITSITDAKRAIIYINNQTDHLNTYEKEILTSFLRTYFLP